MFFDVLLLLLWLFLIVVDVVGLSVDSLVGWLVSLASGQVVVVDG